MRGQEDMFRRMCPHCAGAGYFDEKPQSPVDLEKMKALVLGDLWALPVPLHHNPKLSEALTAAALEETVFGWRSVTAVGVRR